MSSRPRSGRRDKPECSIPPLTLSEAIDLERLGGLGTSRSPLEAELAADPERGRVAELLRQLTRYNPGEALISPPSEVLPLLP